MQNIKMGEIAPLFLVILIDSMGLGIIFPMLSSMIIDQHSTFLAATTSDFSRNLLYGFTIGIYMLSWFFGAAILGDISDIVGRKKSLIVCLIGGCVGYILSGLAFHAHSLFFLILGRVIAGFTAGSQPIAQAAIVDMSSEQHKAKNIGYILLAASLGFILGPLAGGFLSDPRFVSWFDFATPMYFAAIFSAANAILLCFLFKETFTKTRKVKIRPHIAVEIFVEALKHPKICGLAVTLLFLISGWGEYFGFSAQYLLKLYHYTPLQLSLFMAVIGVGFSIGFGVLVDFCANRFNLKRTVCVAAAIAAILCLLIIMIPVAWVAWVCTPFIGAAVAVAYSLLITLFSNQVDRTEQGWVMGVTNAIMALSFGVTTFLSGFAAHINAAMPIMWAFLGMMIAAVILKFVKI